ncbi:MAG: hypothetical protein JXN62_11775, partial [Bacteroidales bacterium]|nr:hypothetical protein [Bacteroidales bacterium]
LSEEELDYLDGKTKKFYSMGDEDTTEYITRNVSKLIVIMIPVVALLIMLINVRRKLLYYDHFIFTLHIHCFIFLVGVLVEVFFLAVGYMVEYWVVAPVILVYVFLAMKRVYRQSFGMTLLSNTLLWLGYIGLIVPLFILLTVIISIIII